MDLEKLSLETICVYYGSRPDPQHGSVVPPIYQTSTFAQTAPGVYKEFDYTRTDNPTRSVLQQTLAAVEGSKYALSFASGMAAVDCVMNLLEAGDHIVTGDDIYGGTYRYLLDVAKRRGITFDFVKLEDQATIEAAIKPNTKMIWFESCTNPLLNLIDSDLIVRIAKKHGLISVVDNTFLSSYFCRPLNDGVDIVMHSMTKYLNGHSDVIMGALMVNDEELYTRLKYFQNAIGPTCSPFDCFLAQRGIKTFAIRMKAHEENALKIAKHLEAHPKIENVLYPGLESHPQHAYAKAKLGGFGGMVSFRVKGGLEETVKFLTSTELFVLAVSLGGVESLIEQPATMTHFEMPKEVRESVGITDNLVRASIGIENVDDLIADLDRALAKL